ITTATTAKKDAAFRILTSSALPGKVSLAFDTREGSASQLKIFNTKGSCVYQTTITDACSQSMFSIPYDFAAGSYCLSLGDRELNTSTTHSFQIVK
ncbi:MAG: hypothetical protein JW795_18485, partial [Chitinivibrionales bacterium]|nr:hypothetical protein [Chitinivibrionales bacterium]